MIAKKEGLFLSVSSSPFMTGMQMSSSYFCNEAGLVLFNASNV